MKKVVLVLMWLMLLTSFAGTVEWNKAFVVIGEDYERVHDLSVTIGAPSFLPTWGDRIDGGWRLTALVATYMEYANSFVIANEGDVVGADYMANQAQFFLYSRYGDEESARSDYYMDILEDAPVYVAFQNEFSSGSRYGWFQIGVDDAGDLMMLSSAWDLDGDTIVVGAIPEPSSGLMLLFGLAALALQRRSLDEPVFVRD